ncbi:MULTISPECIES: hypothetical protein [unclassified Streptomyces]|uniref:hypothetical protein n=1 Tax=unclassified Streptomyces TaxID=2593676 RepID=UPI002E105A73|nr:MULTISPECIES: hypothetical protein [unclassified Streptomyces]WSK21868.1 hypothetical protein OG730_22420 [Streptomyces sp. NBC_01298]WSP39602.1 hypothetical protein OG247_21510 [Streptomyces sp. NBC_01244]
MDSRLIFENDYNLVANPDGDGWQWGVKNTADVPLVCDTYTWAFAPAFNILSASENVTVIETNGEDVTRFALVFGTVPPGETVYATIQTDVTQAYLDAGAEISTTLVDADE